MLTGACRKSIARFPRVVSWAWLPFQVFSDCRERCSCLRPNGLLNCFRVCVCALSLSSRSYRLSGRKAGGDHPRARVILPRSISKVSWFSVRTGAFALENFAYAGVCNAATNASLPTFSKTWGRQGFDSIHHSVHFSISPPINWGTRSVELYLGKCFFLHCKIKA